MPMFLLDNNFQVLSFDSAVFVSSAIFIRICILPPPIFSTCVSLRMEKHHSIPVHQILGGGSVADVVMQRRWPQGIFVLLSATFLWLLLEGDKHFLTSVANFLFFVVAILFLWARSAVILNRPMPQLPDMDISEESVVKAAELAVDWVNSGLSFARDIAIEQNLTLFFQVAFSLWFISYVSSLVSFVTIVYMGILLSFSVPLLYDAYQDQTESKLGILHEPLQILYSAFDEMLHIKIPMP